MAERQQAVAQQERVTVSKRDVWASKRWYIVYIPSYLGGAAVAEVPASEPGKLIGRTLEISLFDLTKDISHLPVKLRFQINRVDGGNAYTRFKGLELTRDYIRSLVRRGTSKIAAYIDVETKDGWRLRLTVMGVTAARVSTSRKAAIRRAFAAAVLQKAPTMDIGALLKEVLEGSLAAELFVAAKRIYPMRKVEIAKIKVLRHPKGEEAVEVKALEAQQQVG
ncbi:MAG: 30S ribosomal protein S3ae [Thermoproteus sp.]|nr:30S ribosomal protein S3ae [Thermoproteus sp.]